MGKFRGIIVVDRERCKGCNLCVVACPLHILALTEKQVNKKGIIMPNKSKRICATDVHPVAWCARTDALPYIKRKKNKSYGRKRSCINER